MQSSALELCMITTGLAALSQQVSRIASDTPEVEKTFEAKLLVVDDEPNIRELLTDEPALRRASTWSRAGDGEAP